MKSVIMILTLVIVSTGTLLANTLAHWDFHEGSGNVLHDISGNGHDGVIYGNPNWATGCNDSGYALEFDNTDDYVTCGVIQPYLTNSFTVEVIFKAYYTGGTEDDWIFSTGGWDPAAWTAICLNIGPTGKLRGVIKFKEGSPGLVILWTPNIVNDSSWHHAALVYDNVKLKLYLDGNPTPVDQKPATGTIVQQNNGTFIGRYDWEWKGVMGLFSGIIYEVRISSTALSPDQFIQCGPAPPIPTLTEWGLIIFAVVLIGFMTWVFLRRRKAAASYQ